MKHYDVIIIGAGSIGTPAAYYLARSGIRTLVLDSLSGPGQASNKTAIGGIRATHSDPVKIQLSLRSLEIFSTWKEVYGDNIEWVKGGYLFPAYGNNEAQKLKSLLKCQKSYNLNIDWICADSIAELVPGINRQNLLGGTFSPDDGNASPLLAIHAYYTHACASGAVFHFNENVIGIDQNNNRVCAVRTEKAVYATQFVINAAGANARQISALVGVDVPVFPDTHEAAITEPMPQFTKPLVVDISPRGGAANFYFYQSPTGQIIFCMTPDPLKWGTETTPTPGFLPRSSSRFLSLMPGMANLRVRRTWRGLYPMTPDGFPIVGWSRDIDGYLLAVGMCGQGFMLAPGMGELLERCVNGTIQPEDERVLDTFSPYRQFTGQEALK